MIVTIEDDRELGLHVLHRKDTRGRVVRDAQGRPVPRRPAALVRAYEARPANSEGRGEVTMDALGRQALRDSPDVIIFGEARGGEVVQLLEGVTNGVGGVMFTLHAESAQGVFDRVVQLVRKAQPPLPADYALAAMTFLDVIVGVRRDRWHRRYVSEVIEVLSGPLGENGYPRFQRLFAPGPDGRATPTGHRLSPALAARLEDVGFDRAGYARSCRTGRPGRRRPNRHRRPAGRRRQTPTAPAPGCGCPGGGCHDRTHDGADDWTAGDWTAGRDWTGGGVGVGGAGGGRGRGDAGPGRVGGRCGSGGRVPGGGAAASGPGPAASVAPHSGRGRRGSGGVRGLGVGAGRGGGGVVPRWWCRSCGPISGPRR